MQQGDEFERKVGLKQSTTVTRYMESFEAILATIKGAGDEVLTEAFKNGLKEEVIVELRMQKSSSLCELMEMAQRVEERNQVVDQVRETG